MHVLLLLAVLSAAEPSSPSTGPLVDLQAGVGAFNRDLASQLKFGPAWGVSAQIPLKTGLWLMLGYEGAATRIASPGVSGTPLLFSSAGFAAIRLGLVEQSSLRPYAFVGLGLMRSTVPKAAREVLQSDTAGIVPAGIGLEGDISRHFILGARFTYNLVFDNELLPGTGSSTSDLWIAAITLAYGF